MHAQRKDFDIPGKGLSQITVRGAIPNASYLFRWFNPRTGAWFGDVRLTTIKADCGKNRIPAHPADKDWGLSLILERNKFCIYCVNSNKYIYNIKRRICMAKNNCLNC